jgi:hypothetical protein
LSDFLREPPKPPRKLTGCCAGLYRSSAKTVAQIKRPALAVLGYNGVVQVRSWAPVMRVSHKIGIIIGLCFTALPALADEVLYCTDTAVVGFTWDKGKASAAKFPPHRFTIKIIRGNPQRGNYVYPNREYISRGSSRSAS